MKTLNKKIFGLGLLIAFLAGALLVLSPNKADSLALFNHQQDVMVIFASETDATEIEEDDDEWEA